VAGKKASISTVSHTLDSSVAERLRHFAFRERISESAVIEFALRSLFESGEEAALGRRLREAGAALRRRNRIE
jgi:predicted transcriptional regulator